MKTLDYFYEEILTPVCLGLVDIIIALFCAVLEIMLAVVIFITVPLWIVPYAIIRNKRNKRRSTDERAD